ncbi:DUF1707 domain-containing protein [Streptomyces sp. SID5468]|nr:DUF1707 domain-containing protein [Streptomyces sp. SID5468]
MPVRPPDRPVRRPGPLDTPPGTPENRYVTSQEFRTAEVRLSDAEREQAIAVLREHAAQGRLSHDTFLTRMELALHARARGDLTALVADLPAEPPAPAPVPPAPAPLTGALARTVAALSALMGRVRDAWRFERVPRLMLPEPGPFPLRIGRDYANGLRIGDDSVSRCHAELRQADGVWLLRDLGSMNGTWINGRRLTGEAPVSPGDVVTFGRIGYRLAAR